MKFRIQDMTCGGCVRGVERAVRSVDPEATVRADVPAREVEVSSTRPQAEIAAALGSAGFPAVAAA